MWKSLKQYWKGKPSDSPIEEVPPNYYYYHQYGTRHLVKLEVDEQQISIYSLDGDEYIEKIDLEDVIGIKCDRSHTRPRLLVHECARSDRAQPRSYRKIIFESSSPGLTLPAWYHRLRSTIIPKRFLVIINPSGGTQNGVIEYDMRVRKMFLAADCECETYITKEKGDASRHLSTIDLNSFDTVIVFGGDGTVSEVVNGLVHRKDRMVALSKPIGVIPTGSGNGLSRSMLHESEEEFGIVGAAYRVLKGRVRRIPLIKNTVHTPHPRVIYSFLATAWGLPSDVDSESEFYRFLGGMRFTLGTIIRLINLRSYSGRLHMLRATEENRSAVTDFDREQIPDKRWETMVSTDDEFLLFWACKAPYVAEDMLVAPSMTLEDRRMSLVIVTHPMSRWELVTMFFNLERGEHINNSKIRTEYVYAFQIEPESGGGGAITVDGEPVEYTKISSSITETAIAAVY